MKGKNGKEEKKISTNNKITEIVLGELIAASSVVLTCRCDEDNVRKGRFVTVAADEGKSGGRTLMDTDEVDDEFIVLVCPDNHRFGM